MSDNGCAIMIFKWLVVLFCDCELKEFVKIAICNRKLCIFIADKTIYDNKRSNKASNIRPAWNV